MPSKRNREIYMKICIDDICSFNESCEEFCDKYLVPDNDNGDCPIVLLRLNAKNAREGEKKLNALETKHGMGWSSIKIIELKDVVDKITDEKIKNKFLDFIINRKLMCKT